MSFDMQYDKDRNPIKNDTQLPLEDNTPQETAPQEEQPEVQVAEPLADPTQETSEQELQPEATPTHKEQNLRILREQSLRMEKERNDALLRLQQLEMQKAYAQPQSLPQEEDQVKFADDELVEGKHLNKAMKSLESQLKAQREQLKMQQQQAVELATEARLKAQYTDFDKVVTEDNLKLLRITHPEVAATIHGSNGDLYAKSVSAYTMIKQLGVYQEDMYEGDKALIKKNAAKPKPLVTIAPQQGDSPLSRANAFANGLTEDLKKQLWKEMDAIRRNS